MLVARRTPSILTLDYYVRTHVRTCGKMAVLGQGSSGPATVLFSVEKKGSVVLLGGSRGGLGEVLGPPIETPSETAVQIPVHCENLWGRGSTDWTKENEHHEKKRARPQVREVHTVASRILERRVRGQGA